MLKTSASVDDDWERRTFVTYRKALLDTPSSALQTLGLGLGGSSDVDDIFAAGES